MRKKLVYRLALIAILAALSCVLRIAFVDFPNVKPITAMFFAFALWIGLWDSIAIMGLTMLLTGILLGFSPIVFGQIFVYAIIIAFFKAIGKLTKNVFVLSISAGFLAFVFGALIDVLSGLMYGFGTGGYIAYWIAGLPFDTAHAISTLIFYPIVIMILGRIKALQ
ncbi:DUF6580 family putative transport protein [Lactococcus fujiensis]|uniref:ECF transporter S component n=1 Tax=Lactococcus fujiensis JCM 16395 TaxID=1291764 RepID=A0A2A5RKT6_9LACT|nr:DUF6580 family putative transport protein [Lactococcus fujiensis]PCR99804.1 hypothetical protein RT41_GL001610 [Lactococcus fujiensis JCM 16395]